MCRIRMERRPANRVAVLSISGCLVRSDECQRLQGPVREALSTGFVNMIFDLENCLRVNSAGIDALSGVIMKAARRDGRVMFVNVPGFVAGTLRAVKLAPAGPVLTLEQAITGFQPVAD